MAAFDFELLNILVWAGFVLLVLSGMVIGACLYHLWMKRTPKARRSYNSESGNVFFAMFAVVGMVGLVGASIMTIMKGPVTSMQNVTKRTVAENHMIASTRLAIMSAATLQPDNGDCDADGFVEPIPFRDAGTAPHPVGGGLIPSGIGSALTDPWASEYGYCVWDHGNQVMAAGCGGAAANRLSGAPTDTQMAVAVISAGKDKIFQTDCNDFADTDGDGVPDMPLLARAAGSDDIVLGHTYAEANTALAGLWSLKEGEPDTATIDKGIEVEGGGFFGGSLILGGGLLLPDQTSSGACIEANDQQLRRNTSTSPPTLEICDWQGGAGDWAAISGGGEDIGDACADIPLGGICPIEGAIYIGDIDGNRIYAAPADEAGTMAWRTIYGAAGTASLTDGLANTDAMMAEDAAGHPAANACATKTPAGIWYLPAKDELNLIWANRSAIDLASKGFDTSGYYWSSTEYSADDAWGQRFNNGSYVHVDTSQAVGGVRCVQRKPLKGGRGTELPMETSGAACANQGALAKTAGGLLLVCEDAGLQGVPCTGFEAGDQTIASQGGLYVCTE